MNTEYPNQNEHFTYDLGLSTINFSKFILAFIYNNFFRSVNKVSNQLNTDGYK